MKIAIFLILFTSCLYLIDARGVEHSDDESPSDGSDFEGSDGTLSEGYSSDGSEFNVGSSEEWVVDEPKDEENTGLNDEQSALLRRVYQGRWKQERNADESAQASDRLMKELRACFQSAMYKNNEYSIELVDESPYNWNVLVRAVDTESELYKDLQKLKEHEGVEGILFNFRFGANYPYEVPFVRVVYPVINRGHVYEGGSICMELLDPQGWSSVYTVEAIVTQLTATIVHGGGRVVFGARDQGPEAAKRGYEWLVRVHAGGRWGSINNF